MLVGSWSLSDHNVVCPCDCMVSVSCKLVLDAQTCWAVNVPSSLSARTSSVVPTFLMCFPMDVAPEQFSTFVVFGVTVGIVLGWPSTVRDLDVCELWSGCGSIAVAARRRDHATVEFDLANSPAEDLTTLSGFRLALSLVLRLRRGALLMMAPVCSSFGWMNASRCCRTAENNFTGKISYDKVHAGNVMADVAAFFFALAWAREVHVVIENPAKSHIWKYPPLQHVIGSIHETKPTHEVVTYRCAFDDRPMGARYFKPYKFLSTNSWIEQLRRTCNCTGGHAPMVTRVDGAVTGMLAELKHSAAYPLELGECIVQAWLPARTSEHTVISTQPSSTSSSGDPPPGRSSTWVASDSGDSADAAPTKSRKASSARPPCSGVPPSKKSATRTRTTGRSSAMWAASDSGDSADVAPTKSRKASTARPSHSGVPPSKKSATCPRTMRSSAMWGASDSGDSEQAEPT